MGYYPDWVTSDLQPENINFFLFDWIDFAFAIPDQYFNITLDDALLTRLVTAAHFNQKKVKLSVGGWGGSRSVYLTFISFYYNFSLLLVISLWQSQPIRLERFS